MREEMTLELVRARDPRFLTMAPALGALEHGVGEGQPRLATPGLVLVALPVLGEPAGIVVAGATLLAAVAADAAVHRLDVPAELLLVGCAVGAAGLGAGLHGLVCPYRCWAVSSDGSWGPSCLWLRL